jgi:hypothetical protein
MSERVSLLQIADWLVQSGVNPDSLKNVARNSERLANTYVPMNAGWQNSPPSLVIGKLAQGSQDVTDETGEAPPAPQSTPASELINTDAFSSRIMNQAPQEVGGQDDTAGDLSSVYSGLSDFGIDLPPALASDVSQLPYMASPPDVSLPDFGGMSNGPVDDAGGYGNNESGRNYTRLPFVPSQNDNFIEGPYGRSFDYGSGGGSSGGGSSQGHGGGASQTYWNLRNKLDNLGGGSSGYSSGGDYSSGGGGYYDPSEVKLPKNRGFSGRYDEEQLASTITGRPTAILPRLGIDDAASYSYLSGLPADQLLALSDRGAKGKSWYKDSRTTKSGYVIPPQLKQGKYTNALAGLYQEIQGGGGDALDPTAMMHNLLNARKKSYLGQQFTKKQSVGDQAAAASGYLSTIRQIQGESVGAGQTDYDNMLIDQWAERNMKKKKPKSVTNYLKKQGY